MAKKQSTTISKRMQKRAEARRKKRQTQIIIALIAIVIIAGGAWAVFWNNPTTPKVGQSELPLNVNVDEAYERYKAGELILDVRTLEEWEDYHIPGTTLIPLDELKDRVDEVPRDQNVVVVCRTGIRSQEGRDILLEAGFTKVTSMNAGVSNWRAAGYPIE